MAGPSATAVRWEPTIHTERRENAAEACLLIEANGRLFRSALTVRRTYVRMAEYRFTVTEHHLDRPSIVVGSSHGQVTLPDGHSFFAWASDQWPAPRWSVRLDRWQLEPR
jgi:hypothetical protein